MVGLLKERVCLVGKDGKTRPSRSSLGDAGLSELLKYASTVFFSSSWVRWEETEDLGRGEKKASTRSDCSLGRVLRGEEEGCLFLARPDELL